MRKKKLAEEYLKDLGISVSSITLDNIEKAGFVKIDESLGGRLDSVLSMFPEVILSEGYDGAYRVIYDKGLGVLQKAKDNPNYYRGAVVKKGTNNDIVGGAFLQKIGSTPQAFANVFDVASIIVGQYYMSQINDNLGKIDSRLQSVEQFLSNEKKAEMDEINMFLCNAEENLSVESGNERYWSSTLTNIQKSRNDAYKLVKFYEKQIDGDIIKFDKKDKVKNAEENTNKIVSMIADYWMSVYLYCKAYSLEVYLSGNTSNQYYENAISEMSDVCTNYQEKYIIWKKNSRDYILSLEKLGKNKILDYSRKMKDVAPLDRHSTAAFVLGNILDVVYEVDESNKEKTKKGFCSKIDNDQFESIKEMEDYINRVIDIMSLYNRRVEIVKTDEGIFIKKDEKLKEETLSYK